MTDELKPCPFCGASAELRYHPSSRSDPECRAWEAGCSICDARVGSTVYAIGKTKKEAVEAWNRRDGTDKLERLIADLWECLNIREREKLMDKYAALLNRRFE